MLLFIALGMLFIFLFCLSLFCFFFRFILSRLLHATIRCANFFVSITTASFSFGLFFLSTLHCSVFSYGRILVCSILCQKLIAIILALRHVLFLHLILPRLVMIANAIGRLSHLCLASFLLCSLCLLWLCIIRGMPISRQRRLPCVANLWGEHLVGALTSCIRQPSRYTNRACSGWHRHTWDYKPLSPNTPTGTLCRPPPT
mmetsp:Transcript_54499/g.100830  ORF Transcript_54499/g.100830 Transcript_54499/m.100830 type:complete len:201 (-) Transcript_54499:9-611(-)